jgi:hypothetical protein
MALTENQNHPITFSRYFLCWELQKELQGVQELVSYPTP